MSSKRAEKLAAKAGANMRESTGLGHAPAAGPLARRELPAEKVGLSRDEDAFLIQLDRIIPDPDQPRKEFNADELARLADTLKEHGQLMPIRVRWLTSLSRYMIVDGERRFRAAPIAGLLALRVTLEKGPADSGDILAKQLIANLAREDLRPMERAMAFRQLMELNRWSMNETAKRLGIPAPTVSRALSLLDQPEEIRAQVDRGELSASAAYDLGKVANPAERVMLAKKVAAEGLTRDQTREVVERAVEGAPSAPGQGGAAPAKRGGAGRPKAKEKARAGRRATEWKHRGDGGFVLVATRKKGFQPAEMLGFLRSALAAYEAGVPAGTDTA